MRTTSIPLSKKRQESHPENIVGKQKTTVGNYRILHEQTGRRTKEEHAKLSSKHYLNEKKRTTARVVPFFWWIYSGEGRFH
jgi:hypothetical protein